MKKILIVGITPYGYTNDLVKAYPDTLFFEVREIGMNDSAFALVELVGMMDGVLLLTNYHDERLTYEVLCCMSNKPLYEKKDFPLKTKEEKPAEVKEVKQEAENGESV